MIDIYGISYVGYESPNAREMADYGPRVFGFGLNESRGDGVVYLTMDDQDYRIAVHPGDRTRMLYVGVEVKDKWAWEHGIETLRSAGIDVTVGDAELEDQRGCFGVAQFRDPSSWPHELAYGRTYCSGGWVPGRPHRGFLTDPHGMGHTVLAASNVDVMEKFCRDTMGYKWYMQGLRKGVASFWRFSHNNLSHNIAYANNPNHQHGDTETMVPHIGVYNKTLDDVGIAWDIVEEQYPEKVHMTLGRHMLDPVISFYSHTPAGFVTEYIWAEELDMPHDAHVERRATKLSAWGHKMPNGPMH